MKESLGIVRVLPKNNEFGTFNSKMIMLDAQPYVMLFARRVFEKAVHRVYSGKYTHKVVLVPLHNSSAKDFFWFSSRFPLDFEEDSLSEIEAKSNEYDRSLEVTMTASTDSVNRMTAGALPLGITPRAHQLQFLNAFNTNGRMLLADTLGLGKTISGLITLAEQHQRPALIVCPPHLCIQWEKECKRTFPTSTSHVIYGFKNYPLPKVDFLITSYNRLAKWVDPLADYGLMSIVMDEVHDLRKTGTSKREAARYLSAMVGQVAALSGTPIFNYGIEMWSVGDAIRPDAFGSEHEFQSEWCDYDRKVREPAVLQNYLKQQGFFMRRTPQDTGMAFGKSNKQVVTIDSDLNSLKELENVAKKLALSIVSNIVGTAADAAREFDYKLRQATGIAKAKSVAEFVKMIVEQDEKVIVGVWHRECFAPGTQIMMSDGSSKSVEDVTVGDTVAGINGKIRNVKSLVNGKGDMYKITPKKGESWICSGGHLVSAINGKGKVVHIPARDLISKKQLQHYRLFRSGVDQFGDKKPEPVFEPWLMGYWLGDGATNLHEFRVVSEDPEVALEMSFLAKKYDLNLKTYKSSNSKKCFFYCLNNAHKQFRTAENKVLIEFRKNQDGKTKKIPHQYLTASRQDRLQLLAGLLDSDGHVFKSKNSSGNVSFSNINKSLIDSVAFLARSLGYGVTVSVRDGNPISLFTDKVYQGATSYVVNIFGNTCEIPCKIARKQASVRKINKNPLHTGFSIEKVEDGPFFGFEVDGDHLFLLNDFTVVHNCYSILMKELSACNPVMYSGSESIKEKQAAIKSFTENENCKVFLLSLRSGAGIDGLQHVCSNVVFAELDWSPHVMDQVVGRVDRDGQNRMCNAYYLTINDGSDPFIMSILNVKRSQHEGIIEGKESKVEVMDAQAEAGRIREMAKAYLTSIGEEVQEPFEETGTLKDTADFLRRVKVPNNTEEELQIALWNAFKQFPHKVEREVKIGKRSRVDFLVSNGDEKIAIECKIEHTDRQAVYKQARRYAEELGVNSVVVFAPWFGIPSFVVDGIKVVVVDYTVHSV